MSFLNTNEEVNAAFNIEEPNGTLDTTLIKRAVVEDIYKRDFYRARHLNYIGGQDQEPVIVSVRKRPENGLYKGLKTSKKGSDEFSIPEAVFKFMKFSELESYISQMHTDAKDFYVVQDPEFRHDLKQIEIKHPQSTKQMKIALIYCKPEQRTPPEMFSNQEASPGFQTFLDIMGQKIQLMGWPGYSGDMSTKKEGETYQTDWQGMQIIYHVSTMMQAEGHRRLIGNDVCVVFFRDEGSPPFDPTGATQLGTMPQIFIVVQPENGKYKIASFSRKTIRPYGPSIAKDMCLSETETKDFILSKCSAHDFLTSQCLQKLAHPIHRFYQNTVYNGFVQATIFCPPINRLWYTPRLASIQEMCKKYSKETPKQVKSRQKKEKEKREKARDTEWPKELVVTIVSASNLKVCDTMSKTSDPYVIVSVSDISSKSKVVKQNLNPQWNEEIRIDLRGLDLVDADLEVTIMDWNLLGTHEFMGEAIISVEEALEKCTGENFSLRLHARTNESVSGEITLRCLLDGTLDPEKDPDGPPYVASQNATDSDSDPSKTPESRRITSGGLAGKAKRRMTPPKEKTRGHRSNTLRGSGSGNAIASLSAPGTPSYEESRRRGSAGTQSAPKGPFDPLAAALGGTGGFGRTISGKLVVERAMSPQRSGSAALTTRDHSEDDDDNDDEKRDREALGKRKVMRTLSDGPAARNPNHNSDPVPGTTTMELTDVTGTRSGETKIGSVVLKHYSPVQRAASRGGDPIAVCELVLGSASTIIKNTYTLQANVKSIAEGAPDSEELKNNFRTLSTATIRLMMNVTESVKKLDIPQSEPFLFLKKKSLMQHAAKAEEVVIQFIRSGKSLVQAHETQPDLAAFQNIVKSMATSIKQLADAVTDLKDHLA